MIFIIYSIDENNSFKKNKYFLLVAPVNPRWLAGRLFAVFQPIFDMVVGGK